MKRNVLSVVGFCVIGAGLLISTPSHAIAADHQSPKNGIRQSQGRAGQRGQAIERLKAALEKLDLTADQKTRIDAILAETRTKLQALRGEAKTEGKDQGREEVKAIIKDARKQIAAVLTPEQKAKWKQMKDKFQEKRDAKGGQDKGNA
jgi:Spy/CpxP family protein refolding chaperone